MNTLRDLLFDTGLLYDPLKRGEFVPWSHVKRDLYLLQAKARRIAKVRPMRERFEDLHRMAESIGEPTPGMLAHITDTLEQFLRDLYDLRPVTKISGVGVAFDVIRNHARTKA